MRIGTHTVLAGGLAALVCTVLATRYPQLSLDKSARYVAARVVAIGHAALFVRTPYDPKATSLAELKNVRNIALKLRPELARLDPLDLAVSLRDLVHRRVPVKVPAVGFDYANLDRSVHLTLNDPRFGDICGGLSIVYLTLLKAFGLEARYVAMFETANNAPDPVTSHASVEVLVAGRWVASDPTFNFSIRHNGKRIGWSEARSLVSEGRALQFDTDSNRTLPGRSVHEYPTPMQSVMKYVVLGPSQGRGPHTVPAAWDGRVNYANGATFDQVFSLARNPVYLALSK